MVNSVSTYGLFLSDQSTLRANQNKFNLLQNQVSSGKKFVNLRNYGNDSSRMTLLRAEITSREAYQKSIDYTANITAAYDVVLDTFGKMASDIIKRADPNSVGETTWPATTTTLMDQFFVETQTNLNLEIAGHYIFAGENYQNVPVKDLRSLALYQPGDTQLGEDYLEQTLNSPHLLPQFIYNSAPQAFLATKKPGSTTTPQNAQIDRIVIEQGKKQAGDEFSLSDGTNTYTYRTTGDETDAAAIARAMVNDFNNKASIAGTAANALKDQIQSLEVNSSTASHITITGKANGTAFNFTAKALDAEKVGRINNDDQTLRQQTTKIATPAASLTATDQRTIDLANLQAVVGASYAVILGDTKISYTAQTGDTAANIISNLATNINANSSFAATLNGTTQIDITNGAGKLSIDVIATAGPPPGSITSSAKDTNFPADPDFDRTIDFANVTTVVAGATYRVTIQPPDADSPQIFSYQATSTDDNAAIANALATQINQNPLFTAEVNTGTPTQINVTSGAGTAAITTKLLAPTTNPTLGDITIGPDLTQQEQLRITQGTAEAGDQFRLSDGNNSFIYTATGKETSSSNLAQAIVTAFNSEAATAGTAAHALKAQIGSLAINTTVTNQIDIIGKTDGSAFDFTAALIDDENNSKVQSYHTAWDGMNATNLEAGSHLKITIDEKQSVSYGITATDSSFQLLIDSILLLKSAAQDGLENTERQEMTRTARDMAYRSRELLQNTHSLNGFMEKRLDDAKSLHSNFITISQNALNNIEVVDSTQAYTEFSALNNQIQASYAVITRRSALSLVNFL